MNPDYHIPVMASEVLAILRPQKDGIYVDCTLGGGGHTKKILEVLGTSGRVIGIDQDEEAIKESLKKFQNNKNVTVSKGNFGNFDTILKNENIDRINGCLFDLGVSSHQLDVAERGFSFRNEGRLDMRMDRTSGLTAFDLVNSLPAKELQTIFRDYGEERWAGRIARNIEKKRSVKPLETTFDLKKCIEECVPAYKSNIHPATRVFMALRIAVNRELQILEKGLRSAVNMTGNEGRIVVISYHSIEDRIVKRVFREMSQTEKDPIYGSRVMVKGSKYLLNLTKKPLTPSLGEIRENPRARSAKIRAAEIFFKE